MDYTSRKDAAPTAKRRPKDAIAADCRHSVGLKSDGTVIATGVISTANVMQTAGAASDCRAVRPSLHSHVLSRKMAVRQNTSDDPSHAYQKYSAPITAANTKR